MNICIEFFDEDPLGNIMSCLKFKFDKVIFLGYTNEDMDKYATNMVVDFLKSERVGVKSLQFIPLPEGEYENIRNKITDIVKKEEKEQNQCFFDMTGGEEIILAAAGSVAEDFDVPMHEIDIKDDVVRYLHKKEKYEILPKRDIHLNIEEYINLHEGTIEWHLQKEQNKDYNNDQHHKKIYKIYKYANKQGKYWNKLSVALAKICSGQYEDIYANNALLRQAARIAGIDADRLAEYAYEMYVKGILSYYDYDNGELKFGFFDKFDQDIICNAGAVLEHYVYCRITEDPDVDDCAIGYHLNWESDGDPEHVNIQGDDVMNEIDVVYIKRNIPTFISCKNKAVTDNMALYELETVAKRFGGDYVRKVLFARYGATKGVRNRAEEMNIILVDHLAEHK